jgi:hypothetical protein
VITGPARATVARPATGAWDEGAFQWNATTGTPPNPPTNVKAVVQ